MTDVARPYPSSAPPAVRPLIVLVEDDAVIAELLEFNLQNEGYATRSFRDGPAMFAALPGLGPVALFILDIMLPGMDGFEICASLKKDPAFEWLPVLMLTARSTEFDKVRGLETGADDYLTKPFGMREFMARVQALIRRYRKLNHLRNPQGSWPHPAGADITGPGAAQSGMTSDSQAWQPVAGQATPADRAPGAQSPAYSQSPVVPAAAFSGPPVIHSGAPAPYAGGPAAHASASAPYTGGPELITSYPVTIDDARHRVYKGQQEIEVTNREYELLKFLMLHRGVAYSRDDLLNYVWGYEYIGETRTVDVHIRQLRRKLEDDDANPVLIETVRGRGYRFRED